jgi:hypothetical protein
MGTARKTPWSETSAMQKRPREKVETKEEDQRSGSKKEAVYVMAGLTAHIQSTPLAACCMPLGHVRFTGVNCSIEEGVYKAESKTQARLMTDTMYKQDQTYGMAHK